MADSKSTPINNKMDYYFERTKRMRGYAEKADAHEIEMEALRQLWVR